MGDYNPLRDPVVRSLLSLTDRDLAAKRPEHRALVLARLEMLWQACEPHVRGVDAAGDRFFPDYRYVDLGMRIMDRLVRVLTVLAPDEVAPDVTVGARTPAAIKASADLDSLEGKLRGSVPGVEEP